MSKLLTHQLNKLEQVHAVLRSVDCVVAEEVAEAIRQLRGQIDMMRTAA